MSSLLCSDEYNYDDHRAGVGSSMYSRKYFKIIIEAGFMYTALLMSDEHIVCINPQQPWCLEHVHVRIRMCNCVDDRFGHFPASTKNS